MQTPLMPSWPWQVVDGHPARMVFKNILQNINAYVCTVPNQHHDRGKNMMGSQCNTDALLSASCRYD